MTELVKKKKVTKTLTKKELEILLGKKVKAFTKEIRNEAAKYGIIIDVDVFIRETDNETT